MQSFLKGHRRAGVPLKINRLQSNVGYGLVLKFASQTHQLGAVIQGHLDPGDKLCFQGVLRLIGKVFVLAIVRTEPRGLAVNKLPKSCWKA